jgi:hypothetical protein
MALNPSLAVAARNGMLDTLNTAVGASGRLRVYSGTKPATADTALSGNTLLADLALSATAFAAAAGGSVSLNAVSDDTSADNNGTATWATITKADGTTRIIDGTCATSSADFVIDNATIVAGQTVKLISYSFSLPASV